MRNSVRWARVLFSLLILIVLVFVGCQRSRGSQSDAGANLQIGLQPLLDEKELVVVLTDPNHNGAAVTDAQVALEGNMNHAGMIPVVADAVADNADGSADGHYTLPFDFAMMGDWIITVKVTQGDGSSFSRDLTVQAGENGIQGDAVIPLGSATAAPNTVNQASGGAPEMNAEGMNGVEIEAAMARPAPLAGGTGAVYFTLHNGSGSPLKWMGADSPAAEAAEIHTTENDNGVMRMRQITDGVEVGVDQSLALTPGTMHLMLVNLAKPLVEGDTISVTLHFAGAADITLAVPVVSMEATSSSAADSMDGEGDMNMAHDR